MRTSTKRRIGLAAVAVMLAVVHTGCPMGLPTVFIPDEALDAAIRDAIDKPLGVLTRLDLLGVNQLDLYELGVRNLEGIEYCQRLTYLDLEGNPVGDITRLTNLGDLRYLNLDGTNVFDIEPLAGLLNLRGVSICDTRVTDIQALVTNSVSGGLGTGDYVVVDIGALDDEGENVHVPLLRSQGVNVIECGGGGSSS